MKMKAKNIVLSFLSGAALMSLSLGVSLSVGNSVDVQAAQTTKFESPGASIRMNKQDGLNGIRFPMFMDTKTFNSLTSNATIQSEDVTFGTLIIPTDKLTGTLNVNTALAKNLVTYGYEADGDFVNVWTECTDVNYPDCMQGYAYIHSIPDTSLDRNLTAVGYYTVNGGESYVYSQPIERNVSYVADKAIKSGEYSEKQVEKLHDFLANYTITFDVNSQITTQEVKYGKTYDMPDTSMTAAVGSTLDWYEKIGETYSVVDLRNTITATKDAEYQLREVEHVSYETTLYNKENIFGADPSVTYKDGYYYYTYFDSQQKIYVVKSPSLEEILEGGRTGWGHGNIDPVYTPGGELAKKIWAPELVYLRGKWYIYVSGCAESSNGGTFDERMFVLECKSQDPTGEYYAPVQLCPSGFEGKYAIDGHAFEYNGQLYYTFSGRTSNSELTSPHIYICTMSSPTSVNNDAVNISKSSSLEEGPCTIVDGTDLYLMYSKGDYNGVNYRVLYYKLNGTNPMSKYSWTDKGECLQQDSTVDIYCTGHNHIFKGADGGFWTSYHGVVGTAGAGTDTYLATRRVMVQPVSIENGTLKFGGPKDKVTITDKDGLYYYNSEKTEYFVDGEGSGRLWKNEGKTFTASTTITRLSSEKDFCAGITLYERKGDGTLNKLLIGVEEEGNLFFCRDYSRDPYKYKYVGWQWNNKGTVNLTVTYNADAKTIKIDIYQAGQEKPWSKTYTLDEINALVSDKVGEESHPFDLHFTGDFEIGLGGNRGKCKFTNVLFAFEKFDISFVDAYGNKTTTKYTDGDTITNIPTYEAREGYEFLGWAELQADGTYSKAGEIADLSVTANREFVAQYKAVGPTYEKPALESKLYTHKTLVVNNEEAEMFADGTGAYFFKDAELAQDQAFVMYATIKGGFTSDNIGFVVGTLATNNNHILFQWRKNDIYIWRDGTYGWKGIADDLYKPGFGTEANDIEMALVYNAGYYYMFMNGAQVFSCKETQDIGWGTKPQELIGTTGTKKIGLSQFAGESIYSDWGYSTDVNVIAQYVEIDTTLGSELYTGTTKTLENGILTYNASTFGAQTFNDVEIAQGENFVVYATVESGMTAKNVGFVLGTFETSSKFLMFHFRRTQADFATFRDGGGYGWAGTADGIFPCQIGTNGAEIALVCMNGTYHAFLNGTRVASFGSSYNNGWNGTFNVASQIGTNGALKVGLSIFEGKAQFSDWGYSTDASVIEEYVKNNPAIEGKVYSGASISVTATQATLKTNGNTCNTYFFQGVEVAQNQNFVVYATIKSGFASNIGFVVGTLAADENHLMFQWRAGDIYIWKNAGGWKGHDDYLYKPGYGNNSSDVSIALMYKDGYYSMYMNGSRVFTCFETADIGWGTKPQSIIGTNGTKKIGLSAHNGTMTASDWGYSTNVADFEKYINNKPAMESKIYGNSTMSVNTSGSATMSNAGDCGTYFFQGVELAQDQNFVMYATIKSGFTGNIGFVVGTLAADANHLMFQWREGDIYIWRSKGGWAGHENNIYKPGYGNNSSDVSIALMYKDGHYSLYMNGVRVFTCGSSLDNGWGGTMNVASTIGTNGTKKIGLSSYNGTFTATDWGYSTDASVIAQYA